MSEKTKLEVTDLPMEFTCDCGKEITLWYNGGELDGETCECGVQWYLDYSDIHLVKEVGDSNV